jgi:hypothetical protein
VPFVLLDVLMARFTVAVPLALVLSMLDFEAWRTVPGLDGESSTHTVYVP